MKFKNICLGFSIGVLVMFLFFTFSNFEARIVALILVIVGMLLYYGQEILK